MKRIGFRKIGWTCFFVLAKYNVLLSEQLTHEMKDYGPQVAHEDTFVLLVAFSVHP